MAGDVLDRDGVLDSEAVRLALGAGAVDQDPRVGGQASEAEADVVVEHGGLADGPRVLQLEDALLLDGEDDAVFTADADGAGSFADGLEGVVDLEEVTVGPGVREGVKVVVVSGGASGERIALRADRIGQRKGSRKGCQGCVVARHAGRCGRGSETDNRVEATRLNGLKEEPHRVSEGRANARRIAQTHCSCAVSCPWLQSACSPWLSEVWATMMRPLSARVQVLPRLAPQSCGQRGLEAADSYTNHRRRPGTAAMPFSRRFSLRLPLPPSASSGHRRC